MGEYSLNACWVDDSHTNRGITFRLLMQQIGKCRD